MEQELKTPVLVASTLGTYSCSIAESKKREDRLFDDSCSQLTREKDQGSNYYKSAQWFTTFSYCLLVCLQEKELTKTDRSPDGTSILTSSADNVVRTFIVPPTLLSDTGITELTPYTRHFNPAPISCVDVHPLFELSSPSTTYYISAPSGFPIRLLNALSPTPVLMSTYSLTSESTEAYLTPASMIFPSSSQLFSGTDCLIALFDLSRNGSGPILRLPTVPSKRHRMKGGGVGMRGIVSALAAQPDQNGTLAAGTWTRWVGLYDSGGLGGTVATWSVAEAADKIAGIGGNGVSQVIWSECGRYLCVVERMSGGLLVFDVRVTGKLVAWLEGREARTNQRLGVNLFQAESGIEIWAGGKDGVVRVWESVEKRSGAIESSWNWLAHQDPVTSTIVHSSGTVVATSSGQRRYPAVNRVSEDFSDTSDSSSDITSFSACSSVISDNTLKIWSL
ncbi:Telomerase Cajal body protein 1 [Golovinomyces cichoracearum]|uniref:Telomerase Cajal body protein 1 n=1 Tax=Golovinomyces cichoracearum TaxID=62708 RepID=A0A420IBI8_9PEZI|nr:Telomerase Cajal body protein 1 [Golovinomyces cichoracearum]